MLPEHSRRDDRGCAGLCGVMRGCAQHQLRRLAGLLAVLRLRLRRFVPRFESIHADMAAELAFASSGMTMPFPCAIFSAYNNCPGLAGLAPTLPVVSPSFFLGAC